MTKIKGAQNDDFSEANEVPSNWVKWNVEAQDSILGTLTRKWSVDNQFQPGEKVENYEIKADYGEFHEVDAKKKLIETPIVVKEGEMWSVGGKESIQKQMANIKIGQKVGFKFVALMESKTKGFAPAKVIKVYAPKNDDGSVKMDTEWLEENGSVKEDF